MKTASFTSVFLLFVMSLSAQLENTIWVHELEGTERYVEFHEDSILLGIDGNAEALIALPYKIKSDSLFIYNTAASSYCNDEEAAIYALSFTDVNENMHIKSVVDPCYERNAFLSALSWEPLITEPEGDLNYVVIRIYMDRIEVEGERNPQALYITDNKGNHILSAHRQNHVDLNDLSSGDYILQVWDQGQIQWVKKFYWE